MSEPELPGIPPSPVAPAPPWHRRLLARWKWPGWGAIGLGGTRAFHIGEDIDFALNFVRGLGGELGMIAAVLASPFFALALVLYGVGHLLLVGEPNRALRHHAWAYVSWSVVGICFTAIVVTAGWGGIQAYIRKEVTVRTDERFWHLSKSEETTLGNALDQVPEDQRFPVVAHIVMSNAQALTFTDDLAAVFHQHGWQFSGMQDMSLRADLLGINFITALDYPRADKDQPPHAAELATIFFVAGFKMSAGWQPREGNNSPAVLLAIGSRPANW